MPSFLSKVLRRKRDAEKDGNSSPSSTGGELLGGRFEDVSPTVSPSIGRFPELKGNTDFRGRNQEKTTQKDHAARTLFRSKSRPRSPQRQTEEEEVPKLPLNLFTEVKGLEEPAPELSEAAIGTQRLTPVEALGLVRTCSKIITARGLDTLGIMHPHWHSASPEVQRTLIALFLHSLTAKSPISTSAFDSEINSTRSPHDVAAVLRWGLRHLSLQGGDPEWYKSFFDAERKADYPPKAFSEILGPRIPGAQHELLKEVLEIFSSLASHAESNSTSGSKLSKVFGLWLLNSHRVESQDDWRTFYQRWETAGRQLEHLFFAHIRNEAADHQIPRRLAELVQKYPYYQPSPSTDLHLTLLPRPKFTTRLYDALFIRVETELPSEALRPTRKIHPLRIVAEALSSSPDTEGTDELAAVWTKIIDASKAEGSSSPLARIFTDDTIRFLTMVPDDTDISDSIRSPAIMGTFLPPSPGGAGTKGKRLSFSLSQFTEEFMMSRANSTQSQTQSPAGGVEGQSPLSASSTDWSVFSSAGFSATTPLTPLASTLFSNDVERTSPSHSRKPSRQLGQSPSSTSIPRKSVEFKDGPSTPPKAHSSDDEHHDEAETTKLTSKLASFQIVQMDEAFIDFWSDALLDPVSSTWPSFVVCKIKPALSSSLTYGAGDAPSEDQKQQQTQQKTVEWVVLEQVFTVKPPPAPNPAPVRTASPIPLAVEAEDKAPVQERERPSSPSSASAGKKRFAFWSTSRTSSVSSVLSLSKSKKEKEKERDIPGRRIGEMGELIEEGEEDKGKDKESRRRSFSGTFMRKDKDSGKNKAKEKARKEKEKDVVRVRVPSPKPRKSMDVPRKSIDANVVASKAAVASAPSPAAVDPVNVPLPEDSKDDDKPTGSTSATKADEVPADAEAKGETQHEESKVADAANTVASGVVAGVAAVAAIAVGGAAAAATAILPILNKDAAADAGEAEAQGEETEGEKAAMEQEVKEMAPVLAVVEGEVKKEEEPEVQKVDNQVEADEDIKEREAQGQALVDDVREEAKVDDVVPPAIHEDALPPAQEETKEEVAAASAPELIDETHDKVVPTPDAVTEAKQEDGQPSPVPVAEWANEVAKTKDAPTTLESAPAAVVEPVAEVKDEGSAAVDEAPEVAPTSNPATEAQPQESAEETLVRETIETSDARHAGDANEAVVQAAVDAKEEENASPAIPPGLEQGLTNTEETAPVVQEESKPSNDAPLASEDASKTHESVPTIEEPTSVEKAITSPDDLVSPASTVTPSQFSSMQHPQEPHHDNFVEIVHPIVDVDKVVTPPAIFEAATSKGPFDHAPVDASAPEVDIIHQIVEVDKVHTPPEIVEAAQEQGGTAPSSVVGTPSVVELTQEEAQPTLLPAEVQGPAEQEAQPEVIAHGKTDDISATAGEDVASETRVAGAEHLELAANGHTTNDDRDVNVKSEQDASPPLVATEEPAVEVSEEIAVPDAAPAEPSPTGEEVRLPQDEGDAKSSPPGDAQDTASQDQAYAHVSDIEVPPKPPVDDAVVAEEVSTADKGVTEVKQDAGIPLTVENTTVVDNELEEHVPRVIQDDSAEASSKAAPNVQEGAIEGTDDSGATSGSVEDAKAALDAQDASYAQVSDIEVEPKPPIADAVVAKEVSTSEEGVTEVEQSAGIPIRVENTTFVDDALRDQGEEQAATITDGTDGDVIPSMASGNEPFASSLNDTTTMASLPSSSEPEQPPSPVVNIASATPRIAPLNLGEESPGDAKVDLEPVPLADIPTLPPMSSASAAFPNLLKPLYETVPVEALSPREERSFDLPEDHPEGSKADSSESAKQEDNQHKLASNLATAAATSDLPSAIEHIVQSGLTPSAEALLDAVQESLIGAMRDEGTSPSLERESISPVPSALEPISAHAPEASDASDATLASSTLDDIHTQVKADEAEAPVLDEAEAPTAVAQDSSLDKVASEPPEPSTEGKADHTKASIDDAAPQREA